MNARFWLRLCAALLVPVHGLPTALASEMYLKAQDYKQPENSTQAISMINGSFEESRNAVEFSRLQDVKIVMGETVVKPTDRQWTSDDTFSYMRYETANAGTYVIGALTKPRIINFSRRQFAAYLEQKGMIEMLAKFEVNKSPDTIRERYSKHARALIQVGDDRSPTYRERLGYPVEIILDKNPYDLRFGDEIGFQVLADGKPIGNQMARASCEGFHGHDASGGHISYFDLRTDSAGRAKFLISQKCVWYVSLIHLREADDADADYESNWATITFEVS